VVKVGTVASVDGRSRFLLRRFATRRNDKGLLREFEEARISTSGNCGQKWGTLCCRNLWPTEAAELVGQNKEDSPEPPRLSLKPSRLEGQLDDPTVPRRCCKGIAKWWISGEFGWMRADIVNGCFRCNMEAS